jgi:hypothetical protein
MPEGQQLQVLGSIILSVWGIIILLLFFGLGHVKTESGVGLLRCLLPAVVTYRNGVRVWFGFEFVMKASLVSAVVFGRSTYRLQNALIEALLLFWVVLLLVVKPYRFPRHVVSQVVFGLLMIIFSMASFTNEGEQLLESVTFFLCLSYVWAVAMVLWCVVDYMRSKGTDVAADVALLRRSGDGADDKRLTTMLPSEQVGEANQLLDMMVSSGLSQKQCHAELRSVHSALDQERVRITSMEKGGGHAPAYHALAKLQSKQALLVWSMALQWVPQNNRSDVEKIAALLEKNVASLQSPTAHPHSAITEILHKKRKDVDEYRARLTA